MVRTQAVLALIVGLFVVSFHDATAKAKVSIVSKVEDILPVKLAPMADNFLYTMFACQNKNNGLRLPVAGSCVDYYECFEGKTVRRTCPKGTQFSNHGLACLDSRLSKCRPEQEEIACEGPCCTREDGLYPAGDGCSSFYVCAGGQTYQRSCGNELQFDVVNKICDIPQRARCGAQMEKDVEEVVAPVKDKEVASTRPHMYKVSHRVCKGKGDGESLSIPGSCNKFYICVRGLGYLKSCGKMQFNPAKNYCDLKSRMHCPENDEEEIILDDDEDLLVDEVQTEAKPLPWEAEENNENEEEEEVHHSEKLPSKEDVVEAEESVDEHSAEEEEEKEVEVLENAEVAEEEAHEAEEEEPEQEEEVPEAEEVPEVAAPESVRPGARPAFSKPIEKEEPSSKPASPAKVNVCADQPVGALLPMEGECSKYIRCRWDWFERRAVEVLTCPDDMHFNPKTKYCDWARNVRCVAKANLLASAKKLKKPKYAF